jgi:hypothetical protein
LQLSLGIVMLSALVYDSDNLALMVVKYVVPLWWCLQGSTGSIAGAEEAAKPMAAKSN